MNPLLNTPNGTTFNCIIFFVLTNSYEHPHKETLERLSSVGTSVLRTDESWAIEIRVEEDEVRVKGYEEAK